MIHIIPCFNTHQFLSRNDISARVRRIKRMSFQIDIGVGFLFKRMLHAVFLVHV